MAIAPPDPLYGQDDITVLRNTMLLPIRRKDAAINLTEAQAGDLDDINITYVIDGGNAGSYS